MTAEENKAKMKVILDIFEGTVPLETAGDYLSENAVDHQGIPGMDTQGVEGFKRVVSAYHTAFPDLQMETLAMVAEGDLVIAHFHGEGTNTGPFVGMPATGRTIDFEGVDIVRFENGKAVEHWGFSEEMKMMTQLGLMPESPH